jgi:Beta-galactosidase
MNGLARALKMTRRRWLGLTLGTFASLRSPAQASPRVKPWRRPPELGMTFSPLQCHYMGLDDRAAFTALCGLGLDRVRLCAYWHEIEATEGQLDFSKLDWLLDQCETHNLKVTIAVGMKAPRWPEFHFPDWAHRLYVTEAGEAALDLRSPSLADRTLKLVAAVVEHCRSSGALTHWQVENEPFTRLEITGGRFLSPAFVNREVALVRSLKLDSQKILLTNAIHLPSPKLTEDEPAFRDSLQTADAVGFNVYTKVPSGQPNQYLEPTPIFWEQLADWQRELVQNNREAWIAEAQAEPWEGGQLVAMEKLDYGSASPNQMGSLVGQLADLNYSTVLLWGSEYWYWQRLKGRNLWWWTVEQLVKGPKV